MHPKADSDVPERPASSIEPDRFTELTWIQSWVSTPCPSPVHVVQHRGAVDLKLGGQGVDRHTGPVSGNQLMYLLEAQSALFSARWDIGRIRLHGIL